MPLASACEMATWTHVAVIEPPSCRRQESYEASRSLLMFCRHTVRQSSGKSLTKALTMNHLTQQLNYSRLAKADAAFLGLTVDTSRIPGTAVVSAQDVDLGKISEVVMNAFNSRIAYVVISFGGFLGIGAKRYAVPWHALQFNNIQQVYVLNLTQKDVAELPSYQSDTWPDFSDDRWNRETRGYYETTPFWMP